MRGFRESPIVTIEFIQGTVGQLEAKIGNKNGL